MNQFVRLRNTAGSSDKVYEISLVAFNGGYVVNYANGRYGQALRTGTKTQSPVALDKAQKIYDKTLNQKLKGGYYVDGEADEMSVTVVRDEKDSGLACQLLNPIEESEARLYLNNPCFGMQEKKDGVRQLVVRQGDDVQAVNRRGMFCSANKQVVQAVLEIDCEQCVLDAELVGDVLYVFDLLELNGEDMRGQSYHARYDALVLLINFLSDHLEVVVLATSTQHKKEVMARLESIGAEGVVFKQLDAPYSAGRPNSGGPGIKYKFYETASVIVKARNTKRSVLMALLDAQGNEVECGNVTIPANADIPEPGDIIEVRYLYAYPGTNALYQPTYLVKRDDIPREECRLEQLKYKDQAKAA